MEIIVIVLVSFIAFPLTLLLLTPLMNTLISLFRKEVVPPAPVVETDFAAVITAYKNIEMIIPLVDSLLRQFYSNYLIYIVADGCDVSSFQIVDRRIILLKPEKMLNSKVKSMLYALDRFIRPHEAAVIFDPDNIALPSFLAELHRWYAAGFKAVQGKRTASNLDSAYACLDAAGEIYYNHSVRSAPFHAGSSAVISGSAMAVETAMLNEILVSALAKAGESVISGEDKILQAEIALRGIRIAFADDAVVYDEKVSTADQVERQKTRWLHTYFNYLPYAMKLLKDGIVKLRFRNFYFGMNIAVPPFLIGIIGSASIIAAYAAVSLPLAAMWAIVPVLFFLHIFIALGIRKADKRIWKAMLMLPVFFFRQFRALLSVKKASKDFLTTTHSRRETAGTPSERKSKEQQ